MSRITRIALALPLGVPHLEQVIHGIRLYIQQRTTWHIVTSPETHSIPVASLNGWSGDGVIAMVNTPQERDVMRSLSCPVVNLSGALADAGLPRVRVDYELAGRLAAEHLLRRGFQSFAYYGLQGVFYAQRCCSGFVDEVRKHGGQSVVYEDLSTISLSKPWQLDDEALEHWLRSLARPVGLMASHDPRAEMVVQACNRIGLRVPQDVAVVGFNNDVQSCEFCDPPLSSVARNGERVGFETAALLDRMLQGEPAPESDIVIPPGAVAERASTDTLAIGNEALSAALHFIHDNVSSPIDVNDVANTIAMSRRWLEASFKSTLRTTPHAYLLKLRVKKAKSLLSNSRLRLKQVATECGFADTRQMKLVFRRLTGMTPRQFVTTAKTPATRTVFRTAA